MIIPQNMSSETAAISKLKKLLESNCTIEKVQPPVIASDAEVNIVIFYICIFKRESSQRTIMIPVDSNNNNNNSSFIHIIISVMLGDLILEHRGRVSNIRILDSERGKIENSVRATGIAKGIEDITINITYWNIQCNEGLYYGEGIGEITSKDSRDKVKVTEYGVGRSLGQKTVWRGSAFYQALPPSGDNKLSYLHSLVGVFETDVDESGNVSEKVWEWK